MKQVPKSINKVDDKFLKRKGIDAHELKRDYLGRSVSLLKLLLVF
ncbi:polymorphic toxin type 33 domain-containing protein, partial [Bacillus sp. D-CC]